MTFLLRAALVIGALSYLALARGGADPAAEARKLAGQLPGVQEPAAAVLAAIPPETRDRVVRDVLARGLMTELSRRAGEAEPASRDTLEEADRRPAWRGTEAR
jgi:hypothetical protein